MDKSGNGNRLQPAQASLAAAILALVVMLAGTAAFAPAEAGAAKQAHKAGVRTADAGHRRTPLRRHGPRAVSATRPHSAAVTRPAPAVGSGTAVSAEGTVPSTAPVSAPVAQPTPSTPSVPAPEPTVPSVTAPPAETAPVTSPAPTESEPAPEQPQTEVPAAPTGSLLFSSDFTSGFRDWSLGGMGEVAPQVVNSSEGPYCEFSLTGSQGRSELIMGNDLHITPGQTVYYEFEEFIVPGFAYGSRSLGWNLFTQFKSDGEGSPMLGLGLWNENGQKGLYVEAEPGLNYYVAPMAEGAWHRIGMQITASSTGQGAWTIYLDGNQVDQRTGMSTIRPGKGFAYIKNGLYRSGPTINATSHLRLRDVSLSLEG